MAEKKPLLEDTSTNSPSPYSALSLVNESVAPAKAQILLEYKKISAVVNGKKILHSVSGSFAPGTLTAIIGTSGAGKTTLLNILAGFHNNVPGLQVTGEILVNGVPRSKSTFRKNSAFIMQDDFLMPSLTPQEALMFCAKMRLPSSISERAKSYRVQTIIDQLGMKEAKDVMTGHPEGEKGLSGGQRKRLSIALEMITEPPLLFLDEPTSGLDSTTSFQLGKLLRNLANAGHTVIATVHQPSAALFRLFDNVVVLSAGEIAYLGDTKNVGNALADVGVDCPPNENPADWILTMANDPQASMFLVGANQEKKKSATSIPPPLVRRKKAIVPGTTKFGLLFKRSVQCTLRFVSLAGIAYSPGHEWDHTFSWEY
jgi:ATP-binding cassette subfamily G (WHITE) protein 1